jgi:hypothetical protein
MKLRTNVSYFHTTRTLNQPYTVRSSHTNSQGQPTTRRRKSVHTVLFFRLKFNNEVPPLCLSDKNEFYPNCILLLKSQVDDPKAFSFILQVVQELM